MKIGTTQQIVNVIIIFKELRNVRWALGLRQLGLFVKTKIYKREGNKSMVKE